MNNYTIETLINEVLVGSKDTSQHGLVLFGLICAINAKNILELGTRDGGTTNPLLLGAKTTNGKLTSVDINEPQFELYSEFSKYWSFIKKDSIEFLSETKEKYDLIFVDDWHGSEHVYNELKLIKNLLNNKSLILLHDLMHTHHDPYYNTNGYPIGTEFEGTGPYGGLKKFINENENYEYVTIPVNHGLTILRKII